MSSLHQVEKKSAFVVCSFVLSLSTICIATYSFLSENRPDWAETISNFSWVPVVCSMVCAACHAIGVVTTLHILIAESFPTDIRTIAVGVTHSSYDFFHVISVKSYPWLLDRLGFAGSFYFYSSMSMMMAVWGAFFIKRHSNLSLVEIEKSYESKKEKKAEADQTTVAEIG